MEPFSQLMPPKTKPFAIGESGWYLPVMPLLSGTDAMDSLSGYMPPPEKMDSVFRNYSRPSSLRATTYPGTKVAVAAGLPPPIPAIRPAGSAVKGLNIGPAAAGGGMQLHAPQAAAPRPVPQSPVAQPAPRPAMPQAASPLLRRNLHAEVANAEPGGVTPRASESWYSAPFNTLREIYSGGPVARHLFGFGKLTPDSELKPTVQRVTAPGPSLLARGGSVLRSGMGTLGAVGAGPMDVYRGMTGKGWNFDYSKMMARNMVEGVNTNLGTNIGHSVEARPDYIPNSTYIGPDAGRKFFGTSYDADTGEPTLGATNAVGKQLGLEASRPNIEGGTTLSRLRAAAMQPIMNNPEIIFAPSMIGRGYGMARTAPYADKVLPNLSAIPYLGKLAPDAAGLPLGQAAAVAGTTMAPWALGGASTILAGDAFEPDAGEKQRIDFTQGTKAEDASHQAVSDAFAQGATRSQLAQMPEFKDALGFLKQDPDQAQQLAGQAATHLNDAIQTPEGMNEAKHVAATGGLSPEGQQRAMTALTADGRYDMDTASKRLQQMSGWEQLGLWGGLGMTALGLLHALSGGGGLESIILGILGLGTAGFAAGHAGLLDQGAQDLTRGVTDAVAGEPQKPQDWMQQTLKKNLPSIMKNTPDMLLQPALQTLITDPKTRQQLDQAAGIGSWGNAALSWGGDMLGARQSQMENQLGIKTPEQDRLLNLWRKIRATQGVQ